jgi:quercetin dioxygenase-like cupin family protein
MAAMTIDPIGSRLNAAIARNLAPRCSTEGVELALRRFEQQGIAGVPCAAPAARRLPACRHLPESISTMLFLDSSLAALIAEIEDQLAWQQNASYSDMAMNCAGYMDNYAYAELVGPSGLWPGNDFRMGLLVLGPHLHYRDHTHAAPELYWLLTGPSEWKTAAADFTTREQGDVIWHPPHVVHATRTGAVPLLALYIWTSDVEQPARLVS